MGGPNDRYEDAAERRRERKSTSHDPNNPDCPRNVMHKLETECACPQHPIFTIHETLGSLSSIVRDLEYKADQLGEVKATLLVNYWKGSSHCQHDFISDREKEKPVLHLLITVLEKLHKKIQELEAEVESVTNKWMHDK